MPTLRFRYLLKCGFSSDPLLLIHRESHIFSRRKKGDSYFLQGSIIVKLDCIISGTLIRQECEAWIRLSYSGDFGMDSDVAQKGNLWTHLPSIFPDFWGVEALSRVFWWDWHAVRQWESRLKWNVAIIGNFFTRTQEKCLTEPRVRWSAVEGKAQNLDDLSQLLTCFISLSRPLNPSVPGLCTVKWK